MLVVCLSLLPAWHDESRAQVVEEASDRRLAFPEPVYGVGGHLSLATGMGVSVKFHPARSRFSIMGVGYGWKDQFRGVYDVGVEAQYDLTVYPTSRLYLLTGASYFFDALGISDYYGPLPPTINRLEDPYRAGLGIGFEAPLGPLVGFYLNLTTTLFQPSGEISLFPYGGFSFYFR